MLVLNYKVLFDVLMYVCYYCIFINAELVDRIDYNTISLMMPLPKPVGNLYVNKQRIGVYMWPVML